MNELSFPAQIQVVMGAAFNGFAGFSTDDVLILTKVSTSPTAVEFSSTNNV